MSNSKKPNMNQESEGYGLLWKKLAAHKGHNVVISAYGDPEYGDPYEPADICLECEDCGEIVLDAELYDIHARVNSDPAYDLSFLSGTVKERDSRLEQLWEEFGDIPMDPETECMEEPFLHFPAGTFREDIWHWFDGLHSKGVAYLMYGDSVLRQEEPAEVAYLKQLSSLCFDCESRNCQFNHGCVCRFPLVHERMPRFTDEGGCVDFEFSEGED